MAWTEVIWTEGPDGNIRHMAEHGVTPYEVEHVLAHSIESDVSESSGRPIVFGCTAGGRFVAVVYEQIDAITVIRSPPSMLRTEPMPVRRSSKKLSAEQVRQLKRDAERIDREEGDAIRRKGRAVKARHDCLRDIVQVLKAERQRRGLSLAEIGERSGIGKSNLSRLENDPDPNPTMDTLLRYAEALGCAIHIALSEPEPPNRRRAAG